MKPYTPHITTSTLSKESIPILSYLPPLPPPLSDRDGDGRPQGVGSLLVVLLNHLDKVPAGRCVVVCGCTLLGAARQNRT